MAQINNQALVFARGIRSAFQDAYRLGESKVSPRVKQFMRMGLPSDKVTEIYGYPETYPYLGRWDRNESIPQDSTNAVTFEVTNYTYGRKIAWHYQDELTDQLGNFLERGKQLGENANYLAEDIFWQLLLSSNNSELLPTIPNAPDGVAMFSATDGSSADRFGVSGGNIVSGSGVADAATVRTDFFKAINRFIQFQNKKGKPLFREGALDAGYTVVFNVQNREVFENALLNQVAAAGALTSTSNAAINNIIQQLGRNVELWPTQRITDNDWFVLAKGVEKPPLFEQVLLPITDNIAEFANSDRARDTLERSYNVFGMFGYGVALPYAICKVNN